MKLIKQIFASLIFLMILFISFSCDKEEEKDKICFVVDRYYINVYNVWKDGTIEKVNVYGLTAITRTVTSGDETHKFEYSNISKSGGTVVSFDVIIDGKKYQYPKNKCDFSSTTNIFN